MRVTQADIAAGRTAEFADLRAALKRDGCDVCGRPTGILYGPPPEPKHRWLCAEHRPAWAAELDRRFGLERSEAA